MKRINLGNLRQVVISLPESAEQDQIISRMQSLETDIEVILSQLAKMRMQKAGLMDDLLSGRVRVTPLVEK